QGAYEFTQVPSGSYTVFEQTQAGWIVTAPPGGSSQVSVGPGSDLHVDFGNWQPDSLYCFKVPERWFMSAWYPLDETSGNLAHETVSGLHGDWKGPSPSEMPIPLAGWVDGALEFDTVNEYVEAPSGVANNFPALQSFTLDAWIRVDDSNDNGIRTIVDKRIGNTSQPTGYVFFVQDGELGFQLGDGTAFAGSFRTTGVDLRDGQWHHVAAVVDRDTPGEAVRLYVEGQEKPLETPVPPVKLGSLSNSAPLRIGKQSAPYAFYFHPFKGAIDELEIFHIALTGSQVRQIANVGSWGK